MKARLRIRNIANVAMVSKTKELFKRGADMDKVEVLSNGAIVVGENGNILMVGPNEEVLSKTKDYMFDEDIDAKGTMSVLPGFVDGHTHPVWSGDRCHEFKMKLSGATYLDIHKAGGGIGFTVQCTKESSEDELLELFLKRLDRMLACGTTTLEAKSGYGLETATELKMLRVLHRAAQKHPITIVSTFLGAHSVPQGMDSKAATKILVEEMIPAVAKERDEGLNSVENVDVFCEKGVFNRDETRDILKCGEKFGMEMNFHGDELNPLQSGELAGELQALAVSHLEHITPEGISAMTKRPSYAVLLPHTAYVLRIAPPPARSIITGNVPVALGSDFCPNAHNLSMPFTMNLSCVMMKMSMNEAFVGATLNSAASIKKSHLCGSIEEGKWGDLILLDAPLWEHVIYQQIDPPIAAVFKKGKRVWTSQSEVTF